MAWGAIQQVRRECRGSRGKMAGRVEMRTSVESGQVGRMIGQSKLAGRYGRIWSTKAYFTKAEFRNTGYQKKQGLKWSSQCILHDGQARLRKCD